MLELDPFGNLVVWLLLLPGYVLMLSYAVLGVNLLPGMGRVGWLIGLGLYLFLLSVAIAGLHQSRTSYPGYAREGSDTRLHASTVNALTEMIYR